MEQTSKASEAKNAFKLDLPTLNNCFKVSKLKIIIITSSQGLT